MENAKLTICLKLTLALLVPYITNCSEVDLIPIEYLESGKASGQFCTERPEDFEVTSKFLFVIDFSSSNSATDPRINNLTQRYIASQKFYQKHKDDPSTKWAFLLFSDNLRENLIVTAGGETPFSDDPLVVQTALNDLKQRPDDKGTPYLSALSHAEEVIREDLLLDEVNGTSSSYSIFFLSDGSPSSSSSDVAILDQVDTIVNLSPGKVYLSTGYYGNKQIDIITQMAEQGNGNFANFNDGSIVFDQLVVGGKSKEPWFIKEFLVYNLNSAFCDDGIIGSDSDADGLCDKDEIALSQYGFDPNKHFSFNDGYGDLFHWRQHKNLMGDLPPCYDRRDRDHDLLTECEERLIVNNSPAPGMPSVADPLNPDTDGDGIIDGIETLVYFRKTLAFAVSPNNLFRSIVDQEDDDAGTQIKQHRSPNFVDPLTPKYDTTLTPMGIQEDGESCYNIHQSVLPLYTAGNSSPSDGLSDLARNNNENTILIYYLQVKQSAPNSVARYHYSFQNLAVESDLRSSVFSNTNGIQLTQGTFATHITPE